MSLLSSIFGRTKLVIKLPPEYAAIVDAIKQAGEAMAAASAAAAPPAVTPVAPHALLADPNEVNTAVDDLEKATREIVATGLTTALAALGPLGVLFASPIKALVDSVIVRVFTDIEKKFIAKYGIQAPTPAGA